MMPKNNFFHDLYMTMDLPKVQVFHTPYFKSARFANYPNDTYLKPSDPMVDWCKNLGGELIRDVTITIGGDPLDDYDVDYTPPAGAA